MSLCVFDSDLDVIDDNIELAMMFIKIGWLDGRFGQTFGHVTNSDINGRVKVNGCNIVRDFTFNTI